MSIRTKQPVDATNHLLVALAVRELISNPDNWCVGHAAKDKNRGAIYSSDPRLLTEEAVAFCLQGARLRVIGQLNEGAVESYKGEEDFARFLGFAHDGQMRAFNDYAGHASVLQCLDTAILNATTSKE